MIDLPVLTVAPGNALVMRVCHADMSSSNGFVWPGVGQEAVAGDWSAEATCGHGLHGWLWGRGDVKGAGAEWGFTEPDARWLVVEVSLADVVDLQGKVKFPRGVVRYVGSAVECAALVLVGAPTGGGIIAGTATAGDAGTATAGYAGTATAGDAGTATAGDAGTATAGEEGCILIRHYNSKTNKYRWVTGAIGDDGIEANVPYVLDEHGKLKRK